MKKVLTLMLAVMIICTSSVAFAASGKSSTNILADSIFLRPLGAVALALGSAAFIVTLPFAAITESTDETFQTMVKEPFDYTFKRPVGKIGEGEGFDIGK